MSTPFAVFGATGQQGRAVVDALLADHQPVRALVRDPDAERARALADRGVELVRADQEDHDGLVTALDGVAGLFLMTTFAGDDGTDGEIRRGTTAARAAADARVPHVVFSSVGGAERRTGIPHFESKRRIEEALTGVVPSAFVRPVFFMENLGWQLDPWQGGEFVLRLAMPADVPLQMVAVDDIGVVSAALLQDPARAGGSVEIAGDERTPAEIAAAIGDHLGVPSRFEELPLDAIDSEDGRIMFRWFSELPAYDADFDTTRALDPTVLDLREWLARR